MKIYAIIKKKNGKTRKGRGFSREELKKVGINYKTALRLGISVDLRRKTLHEENISILQQVLAEKEGNRKKPQKSEE
jgi:large subunit ribosomal protein L13e